MIVWNGMDLIGFVILGVLAVVWVIIQVCLIIGCKISERRKKRNERLAKRIGERKEYK